MMNNYIGESSALFLSVWFPTLPTITAGEASPKDYG